MFDQLEKLEKRYQELEQLLATHEVISDQALCNKHAKELSDITQPVMLWREYKKLAKEENDLAAVLKEKHEQEFIDLAKREKDEIALKKTELEKKLKDVLTPQDKDADRPLIMEIRQGTGGDEAGLFAADLYRMYTKYAVSKGWAVEPIVSSTNEAGGIKEIVFSVKGKGAYGKLRYESGVHRVQRVPTTEAQGRVHTSTATVAAYVEPEEVDLIIEPKDLRIDTYRSSGPGGQHMQKTDSAVRITHIPTGLVVACQDERSQLKNKTKAMRVLRARLLDMKEQEETKKISQARKSQIGSGDRSEKIRTYNFPDRRVTDHRINFTSHRMEEILEGSLDEMTEALREAATKEAQ